MRECQISTEGIFFFPLWVDYFVAILEKDFGFLQNVLLHPLVLDKQGTWSWRTQPWLRAVLPLKHVCGILT